MNKPKIGVVGIPGKWSTEVLADALEQRTGHRLVIDLAEVVLDLSGPTLSWRGHDLTALDALVVKKVSPVYGPGMLDRIELLCQAEHCGVRVFSPARSILRLVNRLSCTLALRQADIPMPETVITEEVGEAVAAVRRFGQAVFKPLFSTKARGMTLIDADQPEAQLTAQVAAFKADNPMMYLQRRLALGGQDLGLVFLGGEYLGTYARQAQGESWNTTIHSGGRYASYQPSAELIELARQAQRPFQLDFTTVDVAETDQGPIVFEVSAFGGFRGALEGAGIDAASAYADYVLEALS
ncbi:GAK system ATP-grasp enzyme [Marinobacter xestospongiae]|uniref:GAK system ATP-grasp enzyme n=1 Tax=Marinobacter xestospongiae TaxID=994319 RepID=A0ABU3VWM8_9GAMM|nr:GAK system ATP-grasp enzyme [Marinobacter xestospongiae]MDV2078688.1 GAK system ATP-grasp enzyme [Marinobacter xestospongiae]